MTKPTTIDGYEVRIPTTQQQDEAGTYADDRAARRRTLLQRQGLSGDDLDKAVSKHRTDIYVKRLLRQCVTDADGKPYRMDAIEDVPSDIFAVMVKDQSRKPRQAEVKEPSA